MKKMMLNLLAYVCLFGLSGCSSRLERDIADSESITAEICEASENKLSQFDMHFVSNRVSLSEYQSKYDDEADEIKKSKFDNMSFQNCEIMPLEDVTEVGVYRLYSVDMGVDESIEIIKNWLKEIGCDDIDFEKELRDASGQYESGKGEYPYDYPAVYDYYPKFNSGHGFFVNTNKCYIQMGEDGIYSMSDGSITEFLNLDTLAAMDALGVNEENVVDGGKTSVMGDAVWELVDGAMSVSDAKKVVQDYFEKGTPRQNPLGLTVDIPEVEVFAMNDKYGYAFTVRRVYKGVTFAYASGGTRTYYSNDYEIMEDLKQAYVINHNTVAAFTGYVDAEQLQALVEEQTEIMSLKDSVSLLDKFFAANVRLEVYKAGLVYCTCLDETGNQIAYPCWQFEATNTTNNQKIRAYVNVLSGDVYYYSYVEE